MIPPVIGMQAYSHFFDIANAVVCSSVFISSSSAYQKIFDALISRRVYKDAFDFSSVREIIVAEQGKLFDPDVAQVFLDHAEEFEAIALHYGLDR